MAGVDREDSVTTLWRLNQNQTTCSLLMRKLALPTPLESSKICSRIKQIDKPHIHTRIHTRARSGKSEGKSFREPGNAEELPAHQTRTTDRRRTAGAVRCGDAGHTDTSPATACRQQQQQRRTNNALPSWSRARAATGMLLSLIFFVEFTLLVVQPGGEWKTGLNECFFGVFGGMMRMTCY